PSREPIRPSRLWRGVELLASLLQLRLSLAEILKSNAMFAKANDDGFAPALPGIDRKTLVHGCRTLMTEFRLRPGSGLPCHSHLQEQTGYLVSGRIRLRIGSEECEASAGDSWCIPGGVEHEAEALEESVAIEVFSPVREDYLPPAKRTSPLDEIYQFRALGSDIGTAGQPTEQQVRSIRDARFEAGGNLALPTSHNALPDEGSIVAGLGMSYVHIPVDFKAPTAQDFRTFSEVMDSFQGRAVFVHCAANKRVSAFLFLRRVLHEGISRAAAERDLFAI